MPSGEAKRNVVSKVVSNTSNGILKFDGMIQTHAAFVPFGISFIQHQLFAADLSHASMISSVWPIYSANRSFSPAKVRSVFKYSELLGYLDSDALRVVTDMDTTQWPYSLPAPRRFPRGHRLLWSEGRGYCVTIRRKTTITLSTLSTLKRVLSKQFDSDSFSDNGSDDDGDRGKWQQRSPSPAASSVYHLAASFVQRMDTFVGGVAPRSPVPNDAELGADAERKRDCSRRVAECILTLREAQQRKLVEDRVLSMLESSKSLLPPPSRFTPTKDPPTPAQKTILDTKTRDKDNKKNAKGKGTNTRQPQHPNNTRSTRPRTSSFLPVLAYPVLAYPFSSESLEYATQLDTFSHAYNRNPAFFPFSRGSTFLTKKRRIKEKDKDKEDKESKSGSLRHAGSTDNFRYEASVYGHFGAIPPFILSTLPGASYSTTSLSSLASVTGRLPSPPVQPKFVPASASASQTASPTPAPAKGRGAQQGLPPPKSAAGKRQMSVSPTPSKRYTVALGGPITAPPDEDGFSSNAASLFYATAANTAANTNANINNHTNPLATAPLLKRVGTPRSYSRVIGGDDDKKEEEGAGEFGEGEETIGKSSGIKLRNANGSLSSTTSNSMSPGGPGGGDYKPTATTSPSPSTRRISMGVLLILMTTYILEF
ncbi:uncharacterized protein LACBIDRAFT_296011 [Laccaria bicolor S238N-H82]|uniref:Predicted protein n=1 Tax=Laccaria bicolor (strain S238N-H82 / ATCC MYA-4686) TaxID=486041 RepID=B0E1S6_LACBS|nr:uncharacterized protein LACBIDRAFT_296011 [Laccaria bicolor S238N-H82]EDQ99189.1 predicted protein [Laccaria bicolor S238N-H82]|eukprot:XP_001890156.1 predicted protein [Laccaria bicolor S238N-H82]